MVADNLNTHFSNAFYETFEPDDAKRILEKIEFHYTPKHGSWLNVAVKSGFSTNNVSIGEYLMRQFSNKKLMPG